MSKTNVKINLHLSFQIVDLSKQWCIARVLCKRPLQQICVFLQPPKNYNQMINLIENYFCKKKDKLHLI